MRWSVLAAACLAAAFPPIADAQLRRPLPPPAPFPGGGHTIGPAVRDLGLTPKTVITTLPGLNGTTTTPQPPVQVVPPLPPGPEPTPSDSPCEFDDGRVDCLDNGANAQTRNVAPIDAGVDNAIAVQVEPAPEPSRPASPLRTLAIIAAAALLIWMFVRLGRR